MPSMVVAVINESLDSAVERGPAFLWLHVNILVFYRFPKSFNPNVVFSPAAAVHADTHLRMLSACFNPSLASELATLIRVYYLWCTISQSRSKAFLCSAKHPMNCAIQNSRMKAVNVITHLKKVLNLTIAVRYKFRTAMS